MQRRCRPTSRSWNVSPTEACGSACPETGTSCTVNGSTANGEAAAASSISSVRPSTSIPGLRAGPSAGARSVNPPAAPRGEAAGRLVTVRDRQLRAAPPVHVLTLLLGKFRRAGPTRAAPNMIMLNANSRAGHSATGGAHVITTPTAIRISPSPRPGIEKMTAIPAPNGFARGKYRVFRGGEQGWSRVVAIPQRDRRTRSAGFDLRADHHRGACCR